MAALAAQHTFKIKKITFLLINYNCMQLHGCKHHLDCRYVRQKFVPGAASFAWICTACCNKAGCNPAKLTPHNWAFP